MEFSVKECINSIGLPFIVTSDKPHLCFLIDTGSTHNIIFSFVLEALKEKFESIPSTIELSGIEGTNITSKQVKGKVEFEGIESEVRFVVLAENKSISQIQNETGVQVHGILGVPFLTQNKWIIDFKNLTITH